MDLDVEAPASFPDATNVRLPGSSRPGASFLAESRFRFGALVAILRTDDLAFKTRFLRIFSDCLEPANSHSGRPSATLEVVAWYPGSDQVFAEILPRHGGADVASLSIIFPELLKIPAAPHATDDWQLFARGCDAHRAVVAVRESRMVFDRLSKE